MQENALKTLLLMGLFVIGLFVVYGAATSAYAQSASKTETLNYSEYPTIRLRSLDKITARTLTFDAQVGTIIRFGDIYIKILSCRKPPAIEKTESAAFLQIWEVDKVKDQSRWIFSGWMFASSPALSAMDHPVYDVWVMDCLGKEAEEKAPVIEENGELLRGEGEVKAEDAPEQPTAAPEHQMETEAEPAAVTGNPYTPLPAQSSEDQEQAPETDNSSEQPSDQTPEQPSGQSDSFNGIY